MDIAFRDREKGPLIAASVMAALLGLSLIFSTWQTLRRQKSEVEKHLRLTAEGLLAALEGPLRRSLAPRRGMQGRILGIQERGESIRNHIQAMEETGGIVFVGIFNEKGGLLYGSEKGEIDGRFKPRPEMLEKLSQTGEWSGVRSFGKTNVYILSRQARPGLARLLCARPGAGDGPRPDQRPGMGPGMGPGMRADPPDPARIPKTFLVVGLDMAKHMEVYRDYRRNALFQTAYVLGAALFIAFLALAVMKRKFYARRAASLESFQSRLFDSLPDGILTIGGDGLIRAANPAAHRILGAESGSLVGGGGEGIPHDVMDFLNESRAAEPSGRWRRLETEGLYLEMLAIPFAEDSQGDLSQRLALIRDRTQLKTLEQELVETKKLAALGSLAAGVAHEVRNPLSSLRGFAQYFKKKLKGVVPDETYADTMVKEADRLNRVITDLLYLARPRPLNLDQVDLPLTVEEVGRLLSMDMEKAGVVLETRLEAPGITADRDGLKQCLLNLVLNSLHAISEQGQNKGRIVVSSFRDEDSDGVWLKVSDNGQGMSAEIRDKVFEPFFTTRGDGSGLGLALAHKIMRDHGGRAVIESAPGDGTSVGLFFPGGRGAGPEE